MNLKSMASGSACGKISQGKVHCKDKSKWFHLTVSSFLEVTETDYLQPNSQSKRTNLSSAVRVNSVMLLYQITPGSVHDEISLLFPFRVPLIYGVFQPVEDLLEDTNGYVRPLYAENTRLGADFLLVSQSYFLIFTGKKLQFIIRIYSADKFIVFDFSC